VIYTVYALRLIGDAEIRYIGQTNGDPAERLVNLRSCEVGFRNATPFGEWLDRHRAQIEVRKLATFPTREEAKAGEKAAIMLALTIGARLFNRDHVPKHLRISSERVPHEVAA
jgi:hypothetical protein